MKKIITIIATFIISLASFNIPVLATDGVDNFGKVETNILKTCAEEENEYGGGVGCILRTILDILTVGVGILGVIGISVVGVQYLTAGGNEEQTRKAKRRLFEIIIGLAVYAVAYALLRWLGVNNQT